MQIALRTANTWTLTLKLSKTFKRSILSIYVYNIHVTCQFSIKIKKLKNDFFLKKIYTFGGNFNSRQSEERLGWWLETYVAYSNMITLISPSLMEYSINLHAWVAFSGQIFLPNFYSILKEEEIYFNILINIYLVNIFHIDLFAWRSSPLFNFIYKADKNSFSILRSCRPLVCSKQNC